MKEKDFKIVPNGDAAFTILFNRPISEQLSVEIFQLIEQIKSQASQYFEALIPAYQSLTVSFNPLTQKRQHLLELLESFLLAEPMPLSIEPRLVKIPVCYAEEFGPDQKSVMSHCALSLSEIIAKHTAQPLLVHMLGFTPGFLYLGGLDKALHCPRKSMPSKRVPAGSVGIGGSQTGIYPQSTPGGWQIIGRTPVDLFDPARAYPFIARPLDKVHFYAISPSEFHAMREDH